MHTFVYIDYIRKVKTFVSISRRASARAAPSVSGALGRDQGEPAQIVTIIISLVSVPRSEALQPRVGRRNLGAALGAVVGRAVGVSRVRRVHRGRRERQPDRLQA